MKTAIAVLLSCVALALPGRVAAQPQMDVLTVNGTVVSSGNTTLVIDTDDGTRRSFLVDTTTYSPAAGFTAGNRVSVQYRALDADRAQALNISLLDPGATGTATPPADAAASSASREQSGGPVETPRPVPLLGAAGLGIVLAGLFIVWMFARRRHEEAPRLSL